MGSNYGLRLTLDLKIDNYQGEFAPRVGARVTVHHPATVPHPEIALRISSVSMTNFKLALQVRHQSAVKSTNTVLPDERRRASSPCENGCQGMIESRGTR